MEIVVPDPSFVRRKLVVRTAGLLSGAMVLVDGVVVKPVKREYMLRDDLGAEVPLRLKGNIADPIPLVILGERTIRLARKLTWYEYAWIGIPVLLLFIGGGLGAAIGVFATYTNSHILRSDRSPAARYALTALVTISSIVVFLVAATAVQTLLANRT